MSLNRTRVTYPPILSRTLFYETLRDGTIRVLDWCMVQTTLGMMIEPRTLIRATGNMQNEDPYENGINEIRPLQSVEFQSLFNFGGSQWPRNFNQ